IKPAPAAHLTLLWAIANDATDRPGYGDVTAALAAGRTSLVTDPAFEREFYRLGGFRVLGGRAVRIDILERLADLIRPALQWKPGTGDKPAGAHDGNSFIVTPAMMSLLGATADDMVEILKSLGYRCEPLPPEAPETPQPQAPETLPPEAAETPEAETEESAVLEAAPASGSGEGETPQAAQETQRPPADPAPKPVLLWRPARTGRQRPAPRRGKGEERGQEKRQQKPSANARHKGPRDKPQRPAAGSKQERVQEDRGKKPQPFDPDSPFAKLLELRDRLGK